MVPTDDGSGQYSKRRILIVDDHPIVRDGLSQLLNKQIDLEACGEAENASSALNAVASLGPDLVIVDISLEGKSGLELIADLVARYPELPILVLSMHDETVYAERALRAGAKGYIMKTEPPDLVIASVRRVLAGQVYVSEKLVPKLLTRMVGASSGSLASPVERLSNREFEIFLLIGNGMGTKQIADTLHLSTKTVDTHKEHIKEKLHLASSSELLQYAVHWSEKQT